MQCYTELIPPSGITDAVSLPFTSAQANNLIVARTSLLQIFVIKELNSIQETKLVLVAEYPLQGNITSLGRVKVLTSKSGGEALLIAFRDAKLCLIEWDPKLHSISTVSIHYYESENLQRGPWAPDLQDCTTHLTIDPSSRCAAFNFGIGNLAIIPFHQLGDDLAAEDLDDDMDEEDNSPAKHTNGDLSALSTPYSSSFVLPLAMLDPGLLHPVHLAFLHEYREPTFGVLYSTVARSENMSFERKDVTMYAVFTLDLEQKASTTLLSLQKLPNDLHKVIPLPQPVSGALLVGVNELIHIDQGGKSTAIGINDFAKQESSFAMADHSDYGMRLEGCQIEQMGNAAGDMLVVFINAEVAILSFRLDGRSVAGLSLTRVAPANVRNMIKGSSSCMATLGPGRLFVGSEESESVLLSTAKKVAQMKRQTSRPLDQANGGSKGDESEDNGSEPEDEDDDDLYGEVVAQTTTPQAQDSNAVLGSNFRLLDRLPSTGPLKSIALGRSNKRKRDDDTNTATSVPQLELAAASGSGRAGAVTIFSRNLALITLKTTKYEDGSGFNGVWSFAVKRRKSTYHETTGEEKFDNHVILSRATAAGEGESLLFSLSEGVLQQKDDVEFDVSAGATLHVGTVLKGSHTVQVLATEVRVYDSDFGLAHIEPIVDEDSGSEARVATAHIVDPFIAIVKDDSSVLLLKADKKGELEEIELPEFQEGTKFASATLYSDTANFFDTKRFYGKSQGLTSQNLLLTLLTTEGSLRMLSLPNIDIDVFSYHRLHFLPYLLVNDIPIPKHWRNNDILAEALVADLGDQVHQSPYLILRNNIDNIVLYEPYQVPGSVGSFNFRKTANRRLPRYSDQPNSSEDEVVTPGPSLKVLRNVGGHSAVFLTGTSPAIILKNASSPPRVHGVYDTAIQSISGYYEQTCKNGFIYIDDQSFLHVSQLPVNSDLGSSDWTAQKIELDEDVSEISYFSRTNSYVLATSHEIPFHLPRDDEWHKEWSDEKTSFLPSTTQSSLKLLSSKSRRIISTYILPPGESILSIACLNLEISEETHERADLIVVGTATPKGLNITTRGGIYIFDVAAVVPDPDVPETDLKLKLVAKEEVKGAVTAISAVGTQGFLLAAQGQKCMVRGLKEDHTILPVAFMDMRFYVSVATCLPNTGLCILGDAVSGLWLTAYGEEPYKLTLIGREQSNRDVLAAQFLPEGKQLYIMACDAQGELQVLQYDPEDPKTERGLKLLQRSTFHTGRFITGMTLLPRTPVSSELVTARVASSEDGAMETDLLTPSSGHQILLPTASGALALLTPLSESTYRRLSTLQNILISNLPQHCGLNPRAYRAVETDGVGGRGVIDGEVVLRWLEQSSQHQASMAEKSGGNMADVRGDLEGIGGAGLGFL